MLPSRESFRNGQVLGCNLLPWFNRDEVGDLALFGDLALAFHGTPGLAVVLLARSPVI